MILNDQHLRDFGHRSDTLDSADAGGTVTFNHNSKSTK